MREPNLFLVVRPPRSFIAFHSIRQLQQLLSKNWGEATRQKQLIEQAQRDATAKRKAADEE
jgi:hypothetical protein